MGTVLDSGPVRALRLLFVMTSITLLALSCASAARATEASWSLSPESWDFGTIAPGEGPSPPKAFTLTNTGEVELQAFFVGVSGEGGAGFSLAGNTCGKLAPGAKCEISVTFNPSTPGLKKGQLQVPSQGGLALPASAELSGTGAGPIISITPETLEFDPLELGTGPSAPKTFTVANEGQISLAISSILMPDGPAGSQFELAGGGTCKAGVAVSPGASCTVNVIFSPTSPGGFGSFMEITDNAPGTRHYGYLRGISTEPLPHHITPRAFIFVHPPRRTTSRHATFRLRGSPTATALACRLDNRPFKSCGYSVSYRRLRKGRHRFEARALPAGDDPWGPPTVFRWRIEAPEKNR